LSQVSVADAAFLAGLPQSPMGRNPFKYPDRAKARRDQVLKAMREDGFITEEQYQQALATPLKVTREVAESSDAPYFVDLVNDTLQNQFTNHDFQTTAFRVYTTLDPQLQRDAVDSVRIGIQEVDKVWHRRSKLYGTDEMPPVQVALVCLDANTGEVKALVGGRAYGVSQLDHALAKRQPGSSFKPFVYATAFNTALTGANPVITPATVIADEPTTFWFDDKPYEPMDHNKQYQGDVPVWYALAHSLNIPAVKVAEMAGYDKVVAMARAVGLNDDIKATPSVALGSYEVTPLEIAGAYTVFPNYGDIVKTSFIKSIRTMDGDAIFSAQPERKRAMDARVAYLTENTMEEVLRSGTGAGAYAYGFRLPAAGKTGTSDVDGWFAGFTSKLICIVWVGFDNHKDIKLEGAHSALPIWAEFMKRAHQHREYKNVHGFSAPDGIVAVQIDADTGLLATANCPKVRTQMFIAGTEPVEACNLHGGGRITAAGWEPTQQPDTDPSSRRVAQAGSSAQPAVAQSAQHGSKTIPITPAQQPKPADPPKKGFFQRLKGIFK